MKTTLQFLDLLKKEKIALNVCELNKNLRLKTGHYVRRANPDDNSMVVFLDLLRGRAKLAVTAKIWVQIPRTKDSLENYDFQYNASLEYEAEVYRQITADILNKNISPNFVAFVAYGECDLANITTDKDLRDELKILHELWSLQPEAKICILLTERVGCGSAFRLDTCGTVHELVEVIDEDDKRIPRHSYEEKTLLLPIMYSLYVLENMHINHNDLHAGNVLFTRFAEPIKFLYSIKINGKKRHYAFQSTMVPYIYDWNMAYSKKLGPNPLLNTEVANGSLNAFIPGKDTYTFFCIYDDFKEQPGNKLGLEKKWQFVLTKKQKKFLQQIEPYKVRKEYVMYRLTNTMLRELGLPVDEKVIFTTAKVKRRGKYIEMEEPFYCRPAQIRTDWPRAKDILRSSYFDDLLVSEAEFKRLRQEPDRFCYQYKLN